MNLSGLGTDVIEVVEARMSFRKLSKAPKKANRYMAPFNILN